MRLQLSLLIAVTLNACAPAYPGPDKQFAGTMEGAAVGAGAGAVTGFQVGAGTGPGAVVGAGFGAIAGGVQGAIKDDTEEQMLKLAAETREQREVAWAHEILSDQYKRRLELHPTREIYPADLFFYGDEAKLQRSARPLVRELAQLNKERVPWSRLVVASYARATGGKSLYAQELADRRARAIVNELVHSGLEPRRLVARGVVIQSPILVDPNDNPLRYDQAVEIIALDR